MSGIKGRVLFVVQVVVLNASYAFHRLGRRRRREVDWVVGPFEVASLVYRIATALPSAWSVLLARHRFYDFPYDWLPSARRYPGAAHLRGWLLGPAKLGQLATRAGGVIYVSGEGFLKAGHDQRAYEFRFLRRHGVRVVCYFTGSDIRSPRLMAELERSTGRPNIATYLAQVDPVFGTAHYDEVRRRLADSANRYADVVVNADGDQRGYLERPSHPFLYFHPDEAVADDLSRFDGEWRPVVVHAPSSPIIKGTQLVRAAVAALREEGFDFEYVELMGVPHDVVERELARAHITLNEFYAFVPGVFGVEAMAAGSALLTSADERDEPQLPAGSNSAWFVTPHHRVTDHLRELLSDRDRSREFARSGRDWVRRHAVSSVSGRELERALAEPRSLPGSTVE